MWPQAAVNLPAATAVSLRHLTTGSREFRARLTRARSSAGSPTPAHRSLSRSNLLPMPLDNIDDMRHIYLHDDRHQTNRGEKPARKRAGEQQINEIQHRRQRDDRSALYEHRAPCMEARYRAARQDVFVDER